MDNLKNSSESHDDRVLKERAKLLAKPLRQQEKIERDEILLLNIGIKSTYGLSYLKVERVIDMLPITPVPGSNLLIEGVAYVNSQVWPVLNAVALFELTAEQQIEYGSLVLLNSHNIKLALPVTTVQGLMADVDEHELVSRKIQTDSSLVKRIVKGHIALIDIDKLFNQFKNIDYI